MLESYFKIVAGLKVCNYIKKRLQHRFFFCEYCKIFKKTYFEEHLRPAASASSKIFSLRHVSLLLWGEYCSSQNRHNQLIAMEIFHSRNTTFENIRKNIFPCLFSVHIKISSSRYEQNCLMRLLFEKYFFHHRVQ